MKKVIMTALLGLLLVAFFQGGKTPTPLPTENEAIALYSTNLRSLFQKAIDETKSSILLIIYSIRDEKIIKSLKKKANEGVDVQVICDPDASDGTEKKINPPIHLYKRRNTGLMHQKILVTDNEKVWIGSANMTTQSLQLHDNLVIGIYSKPLAEFITKKADSMIDTGFKKTFPHQIFQINDQTLEMWFLPDDSQAINRIKNLIQTAKKSIRVAMFTWTRSDLTDLIINAHNRGLDVSLAIDRSSACGVCTQVVKKLEKNNIPLKFNKGNGLLHHKYMVIDDTILVLGSANWTKAAFTQNDDCFIVLYPLNTPQIKQLTEVWEKL